MPNIFGFKGGVQVYSGFFLEALQSLCPDSQFDVFLKHDSKVKQTTHYLPRTCFHYAGHYPLAIRTPAFATQLLSAGIFQPPDLVITTHLNFTVAAHCLKRLTGTPYWTIAHGIEAWNIKKPVLSSALQAADQILCVSDYTRDRLLHEQHLNPLKVGILSNTFDANRFCIASKPKHLLQRYALSNNQPVILTVARLDSGEEYKGYDKILWALPKIRHYIPNIRYILVGKGDDTSRIQKVIEQHKLEDCVTLAGFVPDSELCDYYNLCDVFAMPSTKEGFGIVFLEALACGKPVVAGNRDGSVNALCNGELGVLVDPDNVGELAEVLTQILRGTYPHPLIYQPNKLRQEVIKTFGFGNFKFTLSTYINRFSTS